ncbi:class I adenylate-forming enzyme family protein [Nocardioides sp. cx-173]|uniref:class I adenylate-forming enzyme family protein n=1 Tax=Nocardioides sp. cx-173 TaxID=2898796 RepID=UPI001E4B7607|nr:AMP-binding protein [Nocardioides sp. cx-173]MCD4527348.1 AMP-binding protein [Nocardioides sp. cx-173]UGB42393.1 AMP-binding protein [Nocardioides sp. cx-173]
MSSADAALGVTDVAELVTLAAEESPDKLAVVEAAGRSLTWAQLDDEVGRVATGLGAAGIVAGMRVMLVMGNRIEFLTTYLGTLRAQAVAVPVNPLSTPSELARMLADSGSRMVAADGGTVTAVREAVALLQRAIDGDTEGMGEVEPDLLARAVVPRVVVVGSTLLPGERGYDQLRADTARPVPALQDPEKLAALLYTSGTSGRPRAAMLTHRALVANIEQAAAMRPAMIHGDDVVLGVLPMFHVYGLNAVLGGVLRHRAKLVLAERFDPQGTLDLIEDEACSVVPVAPPVFAYWRDVEALEERLGPVRLILSGSAPLSSAVIEEFSGRTGIPIHQGYGLTEAAPIVTSTLRSERLQNGSVGAALDGIEIRLVDEAGAVPLGDDPGEIQIRGANLFSGYWPDGADGPDDEGWWSTGDVGFLDASGDLFLVDRLKELVIVSGFNVYPVEVEEVVGEVAGVTEVAVIGVEDADTGEAVVAYVVAPGLDAAQVEADVREHCATRLARFKQPSRIEVVDELPLTVTGKVQKGRLRGLERRRALGILE